MATNKTQQSYLNKNRLDKFILVFKLPEALKDINTHLTRSDDTVNEDSFQLSIYGAVVPELTVPAIQIPYAGNNLYNSSHSREPYPPLSVKFTVDNEFKNYWSIYKWLDLTHNDKAGVYDADNLVSRNLSTGLLNSADYQSDMTVFGLDEYNNKKIEFTYTKAFPIMLGGIDYNYRESDQMESSVSFVYSQLHTKLLNI